MKFAFSVIDAILLAVSSLVGPTPIDPQEIAGKSVETRFLLRPGSDLDSAWKTEAKLALKKTDINFMDTTEMRLDM
ncbi:hypothetical protein BDM02DRAFT_3111914 [Thelephora ganbajun]|uniref:Uncharacterized protein n=1 Tax=Thelephora ganbajun TaxID=370292 RepID=A0ACB6ZLS5_THEGA|nr:hypothetical protein BDM02DRAFT_3111914 [Thelephora ganbajun]